MGARFEGDEDRRAASPLSRLLECCRLGVESAIFGVPALTNQGVPLQHDRPDQRVGSHPAPPPPGEVESPAHSVEVIHSREFRRSSANEKIGVALRDEKLTGSPRIAPKRTVLALCLFVLVTRLPALAYPRAIDDEQVYAVVAQVMHHGGLPYVDAVERKPPLLFVLYQGIFALAGERNWLALHLVAVGWTLATMGILYLIARRLFDRESGLWAAFLYGSLSGLGRS